VAAEYQIEVGWYDQLLPKINTMIMRVTTAVRQDAQTICPVDTGALKASLIETNPEPGVGHVSSHLDYAATVECGFRGNVVVHAHMRQGHPVREHVRKARSPEQPYMRPALYRTRDLSSL